MTVKASQLYQFTDMTVYIFQVHEVLFQDCVEIMSEIMHILVKNTESKTNKLYINRYMTIHKLSQAICVKYQQKYLKTMAQCL